MIHLSRRRALLGGAALPGLALAAPALAQTQTMRFLVGFAAGGPTDQVARLAAPGFAEILGQQVVVENRSGAAGNIATEAVSRAAPNGQTLMVANVGQITINPHTYERMPADPMADLVPVAMMTMTGVLMVVHSSLGVSTLPELTALLRREPGRHKYATSGMGGIVHVVMELWKQRARVETEAVHFRGAAAALPDTLAGRTPMFMDTFLLLDPHLRAHNSVLRPIYHTAPNRSPAMPDVPVAREAGLEDFVFPNWFGLFAPRGTAPAIVERLVDANRRALAVPAVRQRLEAGAMEIAANTQGEFRAYLEREHRTYGEVIRTAGIRADV